MTKLEREVRRACGTLVVILEPATPKHDAMITVRQKRSRLGYSLTLKQLYVVLAQRDAASRRIKRLGRHRGI